MSNTVESSPHPVEQFKAAYRRMAAAGYRPAAPSDGFGNIIAPVAELDMEAEATDYAEHWWSTGEDEGQIFVGVPSYEQRKAYVFAVEATRLLNAGNTQLAARLLQMSLDETKRTGGTTR